MLSELILDGKRQEGLIDDSWRISTLFDETPCGWSPSPGSPLNWVEETQTGSGILEHVMCLNFVRVAAVNEPTTDNGLLKEPHMLMTVELISNVVAFNRYRNSVNQSCTYRDRLYNNSSTQSWIFIMFNGTTAVEFTPIFSLWNASWWCQRQPRAQPSTGPQHATRFEHRIRKWGRNTKNIKRKRMRHTGKTEGEKEQPEEESKDT
jgi:hypothetical protein